MKRNVSKKHPPKRALAGVDPRELPPGAPYPCDDPRVGTRAAGDAFAGTVLACAVPPEGKRGRFFVVGGVESGVGRCAGSPRSSRRRAVVPRESPRPRRRRIFPTMRRALLALSLVAVPWTVLAQPRPDAREELRAQLVVQARAARGREDFAACAAHYESAAAIRADVAVWYSAGLCAYLGGRLPEARRLAHACLGDASGDAMIRGQCALLVRELDAAESTPARPAAAPTVPDRDPAPAPTPTRPTPAAAPSPSTPSPAPRRGVPAGAIALWSVGGAGVVLGIVGAVLHGEAGADCVVSGDVATCPNAAAADRAQVAGTWATMANVGLGVGLAALAGSTVWWIVDRVQGAPRDATAPRVTAGVGPASASLTLRF